jgi:DUF1680 family protein
MAYWKMQHGQSVVLQDGELLRRRKANLDYMMELKTENLTLSYLMEAGLYKTSETQTQIHGGWEFPLCELRGHFLGHWLSAAAMHYEATGDKLLLAKAEQIVDILAECQKENGGKWAGSIPEKYMTWIAIGKQVWAPQYTVHKTFMGLLDMAQKAGCTKALDVAVHFAEWFYEWSGRYSREQFQKILDVETGGMLEIWAILYRLTGKDMFRELMDRYYRESLFDGLLEGRDVLTNMHANTTIPEVLGAAAWYEATGEEKMLEIVKRYWEAAVTRKGSYATGGQTCGEIWSPDGQLAARLGDKNQEHCTVYNMMRLAEFLFRQTGDCAFMDYWEKNLYNGIMAQGYWKGSFTHGFQYNEGLPDEGLLTYFLPLRAGARKGWATKTNDFFCCHGTLVQANAALNNAIYYTHEGEVCICQYFDSQLCCEDGGLTIRQMIDRQNGNAPGASGVQRINDVCPVITADPRKLAVELYVSGAGEGLTLKVRIPAWTKGTSIVIDGSPAEGEWTPGSFAELKISGPESRIRLEFLKAITIETLPGDERMAAFLDGPVVLAGLCDEERTLYVSGQAPEAVLTADNEREWGFWKHTYKTVGQERGIRFIPLYEVGYQPYSVYFPLEYR